MNCRSAETLFSAFLDDELNQAERRDFESHLLGCRRCSQSLREMKGAMALVLDASAAAAAETSPHFEDDLMVRIRSGEAMRPSVVEWLHGLLTPVRLRPLFVVGAGACAVFVAVVLFQGNSNSKNTPAMAARETGPGSVATSPATPAAPAGPASSSAAPAMTSPNTTLASSSPAPSIKKARRADDGNGIVEIADRVAPSTRAAASASGADSQFVDEYVTDHFFLQRGSTTPEPQQSTIVPVTDKASDDVYIEF
jgi:anti-sigma factor RsiW